MMESSSKLIENCDSNESGDDGLVSDAPSEQILDQCDDLIKEAKNFNLHAKILKKLLNLRERKSGYDLYQRPKSAECNSIGSKIDKNESVDCGLLLNKIDLLRKEVEESHRLGFCLAYNIQCLQKRLNGTPIDLESGAKLIQELQAKYENSKTRDAIMKYEFQEKRKLLQCLRQQLEDTRDDWSRLHVRKRKPGKEEFLTEALRQNFAHKPKQMSEESGFMESNSNVDHDSSDDNNSGSGPSGLEALVIAMDGRRRKIEELEDEYYDIFNSLANRSQSSQFSSSEIYDGQIIDEVPEGLLLDDEDDDLTDPLSEEFDEVIEDNFPDNVIDMMDNTEEIQADMSDLPWDGNPIPLIESRNNSNADQTTISIASSANVAGQTPADPAAAIMITSLLPTADIETDVEFTQQDMESMAETGEPLVLCRLRRRAVEILISRLRDEKILHESRESELKQQLEVLRRENHQLRGETGNSPDSSKWNMIKKKSVMLLTVITTFMFTFSFVAKMMR